MTEIVLLMLLDLDLELFIGFVEEGLESLVFGGKESGFLLEGVGDGLLSLLLEGVMLELLLEAIKLLVELKVLLS